MVYEILVIFLLVSLNGAFAMAEMAIVALRRSRLAADAEAGSKKAAAALKFADEPAQFLSTVQIGITLIGIIAGVYGGATFAVDLEIVLRMYIPVLGKYSAAISYTAVVVVITYLSLVMGELVPKRLALAFPERIAVALIPLLKITLMLFKPFVRVLEISTQAALAAARVRLPKEQAVTEEDIRSLMEQGAVQGAIETEESTMLGRVLRLDDRPVRSIMTPQIDLVWIDVDDSPEEIWEAIVGTPHNRFPACKGDRDEYLGVLSARDVALWHEKGYEQPLEELVTEAPAVPPNVSILNVLKILRVGKRHVAMVIDEHGFVDGMVTTHDLLEAIVGELSEEPEEVSRITKREDGSLMVDGSVDIEELAELLDLPPQALAGDGSFRSVGGLIGWKLARIPEEGGSIIIGEWQFEVIDIDRHRVDKVLVRRI